MKLRIWVILLGMFLWIFAVPVSAEQAYDDTQEQQILWEQSGAPELEQLLPKQAKDLLEQGGVDSSDPQSLISLDGKGLLSGLWQGILSGLGEPVQLLASMVGVVLLAALLGAFSDGFEDKSFAGVFQTVSVLCISGILVSPVVGIIRRSVETMEQVSQFLLGFLPVYAGVISVSGRPLSAFTWHSLLVGMVELVSFLAQNLLLPLAGIYLAVSLTGAVSGQLDAGGIARSIQKFITWTMGLLMTLFVGFLTIKGLLAGAADTVALRAGKYLAGSFIPVIGGAISDALTVVQGSLGVICSSVGVFGILAVAACFLPGIFSLWLMNGAVRLAQGVSECLEVKKVSGVLDAVGFVLSFLQSVLICYGVMVIISISLMLVIGMGNG